MKMLRGWWGGGGAVRRAAILCVCSGVLKNR